MGQSKAPSLPIKALSFCRPTELRGWQGNLIRREPQATENQVTRFPTGRKGGGASYQRGNALPRPSGRLYGFRCPRQRHIKLPSEPARSVGRTHRSVRSTRTIEPGRREAPEPSSPSGLVHKACQPSGILESTAQGPAPIPTAPQEACQTKRPGLGRVFLLS